MARFSARVYGSLVDGPPPGRSRRARSNKYRGGATHHLVYTPPTRDGTLIHCYAE